MLNFKEDALPMDAVVDKDDEGLFIQFSDPSGSKSPKIHANDPVELFTKLASAITLAAEVSLARASSKN